MNWRNILTLSAITVLGLGFVASNGMAQQKTLKDQLIGHWTLVSATNTSANSTKTDTFGPNPTGSAIYQSDGHFSMILIGSNLPKFASNNRATGTADENKAVMQASIAFFGKYAVNEADKSYSIQIESATFPNWTATTQKRAIAVSGDGLTLVNSAGSAGGTNELKWKRVN